MPVCQSEQPIYTPQPWSHLVTAQIRMGKGYSTLQWDSHVIIQEQNELWRKQTTFLLQSEYCIV